MKLRNLIRAKKTVKGLLMAMTALGVVTLVPSEVTLIASANENVIETAAEQSIIPFPQSTTVYSVGVDNSGPEQEFPSPTITVGEEREIQAELILESKQEELESYIGSVQCNPDNVTAITNLRLEDMHLLTEGTWWEGYEESLYYLEQTHGINAAFAMGVSTLESGAGTSSRARNRQNYYGLSTSTVYGSRYNCTMYFGDLINRLYVNQGRSSVYTIGPKYCPPNRKWETYVADYMQSHGGTLQAKLREKYANVELISEL